MKGCVPNGNELADLHFLGVYGDCLCFTQCQIAYILGIHFRAGEWGQIPVCGSVFTCVVDGRSVYGRLVRFFKVDNHDAPGYASVQWFSEPEYPLTTPIVVKVLDDGSTIRKQLGCIIPITQIDPSRVIVEPDGDNFWMMRDSGYDTVR